MSKNMMTKNTLASGLSETQLDELLKLTPAFNDTHLQGIEKRLLSKINKPHTGRAYRKFKLAPIIAAVLTLALTATTVVAYTLGSFDWLINRFNPSFAEIVDRIEAHSTDQDIRMEVIGAQKYDNMAVVYLSLQDTSGLNRVTERTAFQEGLSASIDMSNRYGGASWSNNLLYFDEETNTVYYEFIITADADSPLADPLTLKSWVIYLDSEWFSGIEVSVDLSDIKEAETMLVPKGSLFGYGGSNPPDNMPETIEFLAPGFFAPMPHGDEGQWISNAGIINGMLHVQVAQTEGAFSGHTPQLNLVRVGESWSPESIMDEYHMQILSDADGNLIDIVNEEEQVKLFTEMKAHYDLFFSEWQGRFISSDAYEGYFADLLALVNQSDEEWRRYFVDEAAYVQFLNDSDNFAARYYKDNPPPATDIHCRYNEYVFDLSGINLDDYYLAYSGAVPTRIYGSWEVAVNTGDPSKQMIMRICSVPVGGLLLERFTLSPLGLQAEGSFDGGLPMDWHITASVETANGIVGLTGSGVSHNERSQTFNTGWKAAQPLDISGITAIIINGTHIPVR